MDISLLLKFPLVRVGTKAIDLAAKDGQDFNDIEAELLHGFFDLGFIEDRDFDIEVFTEWKDNLRTKPEPSILSCKQEFFDFSPKDHGEEFNETTLLVV